jgi:hypothetical protein
MNAKSIQNIVKEVKKGSKKSTANNSTFGFIKLTKKNLGIVDKPKTNISAPHNVDINDKINGLLEY